MEYLSTSSLAREMDVPAQDLFAKLKGMGWIDRKDEKWVLTDLGRSKGGQTRAAPKFGEFIVWPEDINFNENGGRSKYINVTAVGKHFEVTSQRLNLLLSELGWIEKHVAGWSITKLGLGLGGRQMEHESGSSYVVWPPAILENKRLLDVVRPQQEQLNQAEGGSLTGAGFREKYDAKFRTTDGHYVRSRAELIIDNWLYTYGIVHAYERRLNIEEECYCDFYIPHGPGRPQAVYIEYWGIDDHAKYNENKKRKLDLYRKNEIPLIELEGDDINNLDDILARKLLKYNIKVG